MTHKDFKQLLESRIEKTKAVLDRKASEYSTDDRLHNFKAAAAMSDCTPQKALWGMLAKHLVSVFDIVNAQVSVSPELLDEKIGDSINYLILLEAILNENNTVAQADGAPEQGGFVAQGEPRLINDEEQWVLSEKDLQKLQEWANRTKKEFLNIRSKESEKNYVHDVATNRKIPYRHITRIQRLICPTRYVAYLNHNTEGNYKVGSDFVYVTEEEYEEIIKLYPEIMLEPQ